MAVRLQRSLPILVGLDVVTVDGHAKNIHDGLRRVLKNNNVGVKEYRIIADAYYKAADKVGIKGYQMQAITWVAWADNIT